jgi:DNA polymerase-3 subunit delta
MRALSAAIKDKTFSPAYLLFGEDEYRKDDALRHLLDAAVDPATRDFNLDQRKGGDLDAETLASLVSTPPMMAERRVVVIRDVSALRKDAKAALERYLKHPASDTLLVLTAPADAKPDKALLDHVVAVDSEPLNGAQVPKWIMSRVERMGATIDPKAADLLQDAVGTDLGQLAMEIDKLVAYGGGRAVDEAAVSAVVGVRREETLGELLDAIAARDVKRALDVMPHVLSQPKTTSVFVVMTLTTQTLAFGIALARGARSRNDFFGILKSGSSNVAGRSWGEAADAWSRHVGKWTLPQVDRALHVLLRADVALKESKVSSEEQILATAILAMCADPAQRSAA